MREPALLTSRGAVSALPLAAIAGAAPEFLAAPASQGADAALLDLGRRWSVAWAAAVAHDRAWSPGMNDAAAQAHECIGERLYQEEMALLDKLVGTPAWTMEGPTVKATAAARTLEVEESSAAGVEAAFQAAVYMKKTAPLSIVLDILRMARSA